MDGETSGRRSATPWFLAVAPDIRQEWIKRERLSSSLDQACATRAAVLIEAPSGYGKTVALATWATHRTDPTAWLTVTAQDEDAGQLLSGVLTALLRTHSEHAGLAALIRQHHDGAIPTSRAVLTLIEVMLDGTPDTVLIIDDAHLASSEAFAEVIVPIIQFGRNRLRLVIAATRNIKLWCARSFSAGEASQLSPSTLVFSLDEVAQVQHAAGLPTDARHSADQLWTSTQGWPVAVVLALQSCEAQAVEPLDLHEEVSHYVETVVLSGIRSELRDFVTVATTCNRLTADLAAHLTGRSDAAALLEECRSTGLFLDRFHQESTETVYRWHSTFAHHTREIQVRRDPTRSRQLHRLAAGWMANRFPTEAVFHALEAGDAEFAVSILEDNWLQMISGGQSGVLAATCAQIPAPWRDAPALTFIRACCRDVAGDAVGAEMLSEQGRATLQSADPETAARAHVTQAFAELFLMQSQEDLLKAVDRAHDVLTKTTLTGSQYIHGLFLVGWTEMRLRHNPLRAIKLLSSAAAIARDDGYAVLAGRATANLACALAFGGRLNETCAALKELTGSDGAAAGEWEYYDGGIEVFSAIFVAYWRNDMETVLNLARQMHAHGGHGSSYAALGRVFFSFAVAGLRNPSLYSEAANMLLRVGTAEMHGVPWHAYTCIGAAQLAMARADHAAASAALQQISDWTNIPVTLVMAAEIYRRLGQYERSVELLRSITRPEMVSYIYVSAQLTTAALAWSRDDRAAAHKALERSLKIAVAEGIVAPFIALDDTTRELLIQHAAWGTDFEGFIAARLATGPVGISRSEVLAAPLSAREREVFGYLGTTMTADEIAAALHVSVNTVRSHQRSIYRKLGVSTRREAIRVRL